MKLIYIIPVLLSVVLVFGVGEAYGYDGKIDVSVDDNDKFTGDQIIANVKRLY